MHYAIAYKNSAGHTQRSEFLPFKNDADAVAQGRHGARGDAIVEVWKGDLLLARLTHGETGETPAPAAV